MSEGNRFPSIQSGSFDCPHCGVFAHHVWHNAYGRYISNPPGSSALKEVTIESYSVLNTQFAEIDGLFLSHCSSCSKISVWSKGILSYPKMNGSAPKPNPDMPPEVLEEYTEAAAVLDVSPRSSAALLRLAVEKLCINLGGKGSINEMIGQMVRDGLSVRIQKALDSLRVIGNEAVHPGSMDLRDDRQAALVLFGLMNLIVDKMISEPKHIDAVYSTLPVGKLDGIVQRDKPKP